MESAGPYQHRYSNTKKLKGAIKRPDTLIGLKVFEMKVSLGACSNYHLVKWIPRDLNTRADAISKLIDH